jgi:hypothetical protein
MAETFYSFFTLRLKKISAECYFAECHTQTPS